MSVKLVAVTGFEPMSDFGFTACQKYLYNLTLTFQQNNVHLSFIPTSALAEPKLHGHYT